MALPKGYMSPVAPADRERIKLLAKNESRTLTRLETAILMVIEVEDAIARGTKHYAKDGTYLPEPKDVLTALNRDGSVDFVTPDGLVN